MKTIALYTVFYCPRNSFRNNVGYITSSVNGSIVSVLRADIKLNILALDYQNESLDLKLTETDMS